MPTPTKTPTVTNDWQVVADDPHPENVQRTYFEGPSQTVRPTTLPTENPHRECSDIEFWGQYSQSNLGLG